MTKAAAFLPFQISQKRLGTPIVQHNMVTGGAGVNEFLGEGWETTQPPLDPPTPPWTHATNIPPLSGALGPFGDE